MDDGASIRRETAEISSISFPKTDHHVIDSVSTGWTDEKHRTFLDSIEASFVDQLYTNQYLSKGLPGWLSRWRKRVQSGSDQCQNKGCLENQNIVHGTAKTQMKTKIDFVPLGSNPWIRRLRVIPTGNEAHSKLSNLVDGNEPANPHKQSQKYSEATRLEKLPTVCQSCTQDSVADVREVSDQNFVGDELDTGESRVCKKRKLVSKSPAAAPINDQVVPSKNTFLAPNMNADYAYLDEENAESSHRTSEQTASFTGQG